MSFEPAVRNMYLNKIFMFCVKSFNFDQTYYLNTGSKTQNVEDLSLDLIFHIISDDISKALVDKTPS